MLKNDTKINFPDQALTTLNLIMDKYGLNETPKELFEKIVANKVSSVALITELTKKSARNEINFEQFVTNLKTNLKLPTKQIESLVREIQNSVIALAKKTTESSQAKPQNNNPDRTIKKEDTYREPVEIK